MPIELTIFNLLQTTTLDRRKNGMAGWCTSTDSTSNDGSTCKHKGTSELGCDTTEINALCFSWPPDTQ
jgi:hypothetical protein